MKKIFTLLSVALFSATAWAQTYNSPESIEFDYANNRWFIANNGAGQILSRSSATGVLAIFASGIPSGPHGLEIVNDTLYACDGGTLKGYNINTGTQVLNMNFGATFLNGITHDNSGNIYVTDFTAKKIYRYTVATRQFNVYVAATVTTPNGIIFDQANNRCVFVNWGTSAPIKQVSLVDSTVATVTATTLGNCDGIARDGSGNYYVSSWSGGSKVTRFTSSFATPTTVISTGLSSPADIFYNVLTDTLGVPNSGTGNNTTYHYFGTTTGIESLPDEEAAHLTMSPNPVTATAEIRYNVIREGMVSVKIYDVEGKLVKTIVSEQQQAGPRTLLFNRNDLAAGTYILQLETASGKESLRMFISR